jgi:hypothetical protein
VGFFGKIFKPPQPLLIKEGIELTPNSGVDLTPMIRVELFSEGVQMQCISFRHMWQYPPLCKGRLVGFFEKD